MTQNINIDINTDTYTIGGDNAYIYESPDGGKTIRRRPAGGTHVTSLDSISADLVSLEDNDFISARYRKILDDQLWYEIRTMAKTNEGLQDILNQAIILHRLLKEEQ